MLKKLISIVGILAVLANHPAVAAFAMFQAAAPQAGSSCTNTQISSTPLGNFNFFGTGSNGATGTNADSTIGYTATNFATTQTTLSFPADCVYTFTVPAYQNANPGITDQNTISVFVDGRPIPAVSPADDAHYWVQQVTNSSPVQNYSFQAELKAGAHNVTVGFMVTQNLALQSATMGVHGDRLIVTQTSTAYVAEPAGSVDPYQYPGSALSYPKSAIGSGATWSSGSTAADVSLQAGASGAFIHVNDGNGHPHSIGSGANAGTYTQAQPTDPFMDFGGTNPHAFAQMANPVTVASGSDAFCALADGANHRYLWWGTDSCSFTAPGTVSVGNGGWYDSYDRNPSIDQHPTGDLLTIRAQEVVTDGKIAHTVLLTTQYSQMAVPSSSMIASGSWPVDTADYACTTAGSGGSGPSLCTGSLPWGSLMGIPSSVNCSGLGLTASGLILCHAFQDYGAQQNINSGNAASPVTTLVAEQNSNSTYVSDMTDMSNDFNSILVAQLRIMTNNTSSNFYGCSPTPCKGGGSPRVAIQSGIQSGLASITTSPYAPSAPILTKVGALQYNNASGATIPTQSNIPVGSTVVIPIWGSQAANTTYGTMTLSNGVNSVSCPITQSTANTTNVTQGIAVCVNVANAYNAGSTVSLTTTGSGSWSSSIWIVNTAVTTANGGVDQTAQNGNNGNANSFSLSTLALAQTNEIVIGTWGGVVGASFSSVADTINGLSTQSLGDNTFVWGDAARVTSSGAATYGSNYTPNGGGTTTTSAVVVTLKTPYLLKRDIDPDANDNSPAFLDQAA